MSRDLHFYVVDDNLALAKTAEAVLENAGHRVTVWTESRPALEAILRERPQVVLLDLMMPDMDGFEVCRRLRATSSVPVLFLSARDTELDKVVGLELGADDYVTKPFSLEEVVARIRAVRSILQPTDRLVADANTGWTQHDAVRVARAVRDLDVYIEQPCLTYEECLAVRRQTDHAFVLDSFRPCDGQAALS